MARRARYDALVLGVGGMGAAALAHLAARGLRVAGIEQDEVPSLRGSSVGETRVIRKAYAEDPRYVPLLVQAYALWRELEARAGDTLFVRTGCLNVGPAGHEAIAGVLESVARHGLPYEQLEEDALRARFALVPAAGDVGVFEQDAGFLRVEACTRAHARWATEAGAELFTRRRVTDLDVTPGSVRVTLDDGAELTAEKAVVAAGAWLADAPWRSALAPALPLTVERQVQLWFAPLEDAPARPPRLPVFIHFVEGGAFYGIPPDSGGLPGVKVCRHHGGETTSAAALDRSLRPEDERVVRDYVRAHLPVAGGSLLRARVCIYTNTPDLHFVVGALAAHPHVIVLGGFSGHGYKFASALGAVAADLVERGRTDSDLGMFSPARFG